MITALVKQEAFDHWSCDKETVAKTIYEKWKEVSSFAVSQQYILSGMLMEDIEYLLDYLSDRGVSTVYDISLKGTRFPKEAIQSSTYHLKLIIGMEYNDNIESLIQFL